MTYEFEVVNLGQAENLVEFVQPEEQPETEITRSKALYPSYSEDVDE